MEPECGLRIAPPPGEALAPLAPPAQLALATSAPVWRAARHAVADRNLVFHVALTSEPPGYYRLAMVFIVLCVVPDIRFL